MSKNVINNPSGRKRLPEDEKFLPPISVRYTAKQMKRLERKAKKQGVSLSEHIREGSLKCIVRARVTKSLMKEVHSCRRCQLAIKEKEPEDDELLQG